MNRITICLWFNGNAEEAATFYTSTFQNSHAGSKVPFSKAAAEATGRPQGSLMTQEITLENQSILLLNGGPDFKPTPAGSFMVWCDSEKEIDALWQRLSENGMLRMGLQEYPWAKKYGWTTDRFGFDWQLILAPNPTKGKIAPTLLFVDKLFGKAEEALTFYADRFPGAKIEVMEKSPDNEFVLFSLLTIDGQPLVAMDGQGEHGFTFTEAFSLMVDCANQKEIDHFWSKLVEKGGQTSVCGWLKDRFGVSWQIIPSMIHEAMRDPKTFERVHGAVMKCTKLEISKLEEAARR